ncbi:MAG: hypothetical protein FJW34_01880 [Acidobacteria bacterium]|nr:hypothetical protein [Acidobacteriota bacterium]
MKPVRWTPHALDNLAAREIDPKEAQQALLHPDCTRPTHLSRTMRLRRYPDRTLNQDMLLCVVTEETIEETVVVTVFKTSPLERYLREVQP